MNISAWSIRHPVPSLVLFLVLLVLGLASFRSLPVTKFPNIDLPIIQARIYQSGAAPSELETQVTKRVEDAIAGINGVKHITSSVTEGSSVTTVEFRLEIDPDRALNDIKDAVQRIRTDLPRTIEEPVVTRVEIEGLPIVTYAASAPAMTPEELSWFVDDTLVRLLQGVKGVSEVRRIGGVLREIRVNLDPDRLLAYGVTAGDVNRQVRASNVNLAGGRGEIAGREQAIRTLASKQTVVELAQTAIALPGGRKVRLDQLGTVTDTIEEPRTYAKLDGQSIVAFSISRAKGESDTTVAAATADKIEEIKKLYPDVALKRIDNTVDYTFGVYQSTMKTLLEGAVLAIVVVFIFLRDLRATVIAAIALPLSIIPAFWAMEAMGFSLNLISLLAITIVTGILVDDAIVEIENIVRHIQMGKSPYRASLEAADEIGLAVIAITATIIAVFTPVSFMGGIAGQYFKQFGLVVAAAVFFSLLVARLITPLLAAYFMRPHGSAPEEGRLMRTYTRIVGWSVRHRIKTVALGFLIFFASIGSFYLIPKGFIPQEDSGRMLLGVELPPGSRIGDTDRTTTEVTRRIKARADVDNVFVIGGTLLGSGEEVRKATLIITLKPRDERKLKQSQIQEEIGRDISDMPDIRYFFVEDDGQRQFQLVVTGRDGDAVTKVAADLTSQAKRVPSLVNVVSTAELDRPELRVYPRSEVAAELGVNTEAISETVRIATIGDVGANLAKFDIGDRQVPIRVQLKEGARESRQLIEELKIATTSGAAVPLSTVATFDYGQGPTAIDRYDRTRRIVLGAGLVTGTPLGDAVDAVMALPAAKDLPEGVEIKQFGAAEVMGEVFESFEKAMGSGLMMVYAVLVLLFASFLQPITILFSLPLSIGGAITALAITGDSISLPVVIGVLMLMGIVTKNAIMLVDFAVEEIRRGVERNEAIIDAGRKRARPIIMTTIAMVGGMLPSALALESGGEFRAPMAVAVIGGLISSTVLSLLFVPAVFALMDDFAKWIWHFFSGQIGSADEPEEAPRLLPRPKAPHPAE
ncbi:MAG: efflux RND transporter permease subunit [Hyphomicrobium sp.]|jgi:hydrophobe/amphiphile efflux-1 (HAE1) family protein|uniref:efflux RND transporter permease subunit n=1 Tax=Hyphomicrobium sp. TaxID=82 RepID=UPI0025B82829|nr:efflux RND transporter permease subunit [Hyphomicrobium sp.]MBX9863403.1 efflux RND transporter permease subunit [Hyphomicrobium sp.]